MALGKAFGLLTVNVASVAFITFWSAVLGYYLWSGMGLMVMTIAGFFLSLLFVLVVGLFVIFGGVDWLRLRAADESDEEPVEPAD